ncbi:MAG: DGQHR domain-containing protein [Paraburkholderia tropica]|nr:DGQHR domain-containing protein [Paraburkholderia tropica]
MATKKAKTKVLTFPCLHVKQEKHTFFLTKMDAQTVTLLSYAAVRGQSAEEGAVQRVLNTSRIVNIKRFVMNGGNFPNAFVLNWVNTDVPLEFSETEITVPMISQSAQIIDGQHRIAGIREAIQEEERWGKLEVPVVIYAGLGTQECADIFLSINTEQKPVPRSLVFDLYGVASTEIVDPAAERARDIVVYLNDDEDSPYHEQIKLPGAPTRRGGIALSTAVSAIKPLVEEKGDFERIGVKELNMQKQIIMNLFSALSRKYGAKWSEKDNAFMYAAGFTGAINFLQLKLIPYCTQRSSFTAKTIAECLSLPENRLIEQSELKSLGGSEATKRVYERLAEQFRPKVEAKELEL